jgi:hypothetical protein
MMFKSFFLGLNLSLGKGLQNITASEKF